MLSFEDSCFEAAKRFVQTAVIIDDEAEYFDHGTEETPLAPTQAPPVGLTDTTDSDPTESEPAVSEDGPITDTSELDHSLNISSVVSGFADLKITCGVQRPHFGDDVQNDEKLMEWALNCAEFADITIIDWWLKDDKHKAIDIIIDLLRKDNEVGGRVRLLCVYTAMPNPRNILNDIRKNIEDMLDLPITGDQKDLAYTVDHKVRIVVLNKTKSKDNGTNSKVVSSDKLAETVLKEFSILVGGLIPCAALHSISAVREQTHSLLALFNKNLDGAFCSHRALIPDPGDSVDYALNLISQEISTRILCDEMARHVLDTELIKSWYDGQALPANKYPLDKAALWNFLKSGGTNLSEVQKLRAKGWLNKKQSSANILKDNKGNTIDYPLGEIFIDNAQYNKIKGCSPPSENNPDKFTELFYSEPADAKKASNELSRLTCSSKDDSDLRKLTDDGLFLRLGSVLQVNNEDGDYWLCLQPLCDSVRLDEKTEILFLELFKGTDGNTDFVIKLQDGSYMPLSIKAHGGKPRLKIWLLPPDKDSRRILIKKVNKNPKFTWVADLRPDKAQTIAQKVLTNASRIGIDEFEILRRKESQFEL